MADRYLDGVDVTAKTITLALQSFTYGMIVTFTMARSAGLIHVLGFYVLLIPFAVNILMQV